MTEGDLQVDHIMIERAYGSSPRNIFPEKQGKRLTKRILSWIP